MAAAAVALELFDVFAIGVVNPAPAASAAEAAAGLGILQLVVTDPRTEVQAGGRGVAGGQVIALQLVFIEPQLGLVVVVIAPPAPITGTSPTTRDWIPN